MMQTRTMRGRAARAASALLATVVLLAGSAAANGVSAQAGGADARWQPWLGCWAPVGALDGVDSRMLCVLPVEGSAAVELATIDSGRVLVRERVVANGEQMKSEQSGCTGWKSAQWSPTGEQLYLKSDFDCGNGLHRKSSGIFAMAPGGIWLDVQGVSANDGAGGGVRVIHYRSASAPDVLRDQLARVTSERELALSTARTAAARNVSLEDVINASRAVDPGVVEAWLIERGQKFAVDSKQLVQLADAGVPSRVIDAMVALSYPKVFAIAGSNDIGMRSGELALEPEASSGRTIYTTMYPYGYGYYGFGLSPFDYLYSPFGYTPYGYGPGFGFGYGWYPAGGPVVIIRNPNVNAPEHGRVVNGRGYIRGGQSGNDGSARGRSRNDSPSTTGSSSRGGSSASPAPSPSGGQSTGRTAKPRTP